MNIKIVCLILIFNLFGTLNIKGQWNPGPGNEDTLSLTVLSGGQVFFRYKGYNEIENGITFSNWTNLSLYFADEIGDDDNLSLMFYSSSSNLIGEQGNLISLDYIQVRATCNGCSGVTSNGWQDLSISPGLSLLTGIDGSDNPGTTYDITLDFRCGTGVGGLIGEPSDYYYVDIIFDVE